MPKICENKKICFTTAIWVKYACIMIFLGIIAFCLNQSVIPGL